MFTGQCASQALPPALTAEQRALIAATHIAATVGVESAAGRGASCLRHLQARNIFSRADYIGKLQSPPDLVVRVFDETQGVATIPCFTAVSLGIIPTMVTEQHGCSLIFSLPKNPQRRVVVPFRYRGRSTLGFAAALFNASPNYTSKEPETSARFGDAVVWSVVSQRDEIEALLKK